MHMTTDKRLERETRLRLQLLHELRMMTRRVAELEAIAGRNHLARTSLAASPAGHLALALLAQLGRRLSAPWRAAHVRLLTRAPRV